MTDRKKLHVTFLSVDEMLALDVIATSILNNKGKVEWKMPVSKEWLKDLESAHQKLTKKIEELSEADGE